MEVISVEKEYRNSKRAINYFFHYTSPDVLIKIIEGGSLQFTNCMFMNDEEEYNYIFHVFDEIGKEGIDDYVHTFIAKMKDMFSTENRGIVGIPGKLSPISDSYASYYILCGSTDGDSIPMWNYYIKDGHHYGYAIHMDAMKISQMLNDVNGEFIYGRIVYDIEEQKKIIKNFIKQLDEKYNCVNGKIDEDAIDSYQDEYYEFIQHIRLFFKDSSFRHESEFRIALLILNNDKDIERGYFARNGVITPFVKTKSDRLPIDKIVMSKAIDENIGEFGVRELLNNYGYEKEVEIVKSKVKVRF